MENNRRGKKTNHNKNYQENEAWRKGKKARNANFKQTWNEETKSWQKTFSVNAIVSGALCLDTAS